MQTRTTTVTAAGGIHARVAFRLADCAAGFASTLFLVSPRAVGLGDTMGLLALGVRAGDQVTLVADGADEQEAVEAALAVLHD